MDHRNPLDDPLLKLVNNFVIRNTEEQERLGYGKKKSGRPEKKLEALIGKSLEEKGISVQYQVVCDAGIADIVTPDAIYEVKADLYSNKAFEAVGQVLIYRQLINPSAKAIVAGYAHKGGRSVLQSQLSAMQLAAERLGVEFLFWEKED